MITNKNIVEKIKKHQNIAIFAHRDPDPDALGSMFGLKGFCARLGKKADVFAIDKYDNYLSYIFPMQETKSDFHAENYDLVIIVDLHTIDRTEEDFHAELSKCKNIIVIDHHEVSQSDVVPTKNIRVVSQVAAASQLVIELFKQEKIAPDKQTATYLYAGMMGDTDRFLHNNLSKRVFEDAIYLQECKADIQHVYDFMYRYITQEQIKVNQYLYNNLKFLDNGKTAYVIFSKKEMKKLGVDIDAVKEFSNTLVRIKGVELSFLIYQRKEKEYKVSLRSSFVNLIPFCNKYGGGGHENAAGFSVEYTMKEIEKRLPEWSKEILNG